MATAQQIAASRRNGKKSSGPKTPDGKNRARFNALKHGMRAQITVLPDEDAQAYQGRLDAWEAGLRPRDDLEHYLAAEAVRASWRLDRADRVETARLVHLLRHAPGAAAHQGAGAAAALGRRLLHDPLGVAFADSTPKLPSRISQAELVGPLEHPAAIVHQLEATAAGCQWLLERWAALRDRLDQDPGWSLPQQLEAIHLLGKQIYDEDKDPDVGALFPPRSVIEAVYHERGYDPNQVSKERVARAVYQEKSHQIARALQEPTPEEAAAERARFRAIIDRAVGRLELLAAGHRQRALADAREASDRLAFDDSPEGERLRRYQFACGRSLYRALETLLKLRRDRDPPDDDSGEPGGDAEAPPAPPGPSVESLPEPQADPVAGVSCEPVEARDHANPPNEPTAGLEPNHPDSSAIATTAEPAAHPGSGLPTESADPKTDSADPTEGTETTVRQSSETANPCSLSGPSLPSPRRLSLHGFAFLAAFAALSAVSPRPDRLPVGLERGVWKNPANEPPPGGGQQDVESDPGKPHSGLSGAPGETARTIPTSVERGAQPREPIHGARRVVARGPQTAPTSLMTRSDTPTHENGCLQAWAREVPSYFQSNPSSRARGVKRHERTHDPWRGAGGGNGDPTCRTARTNPSPTVGVARTAAHPPRSPAAPDFNRGPRSVKMDKTNGRVLVWVLTDHGSRITIPMGDASRC